MIDKVAAVLRREHRLLTVNEIAWMADADPVEVVAALDQLATDGRADRRGEHPVRWQHRGTWVKKERTR